MFYSYCTNVKRHKLYVFGCTCVFFLFVFIYIYLSIWVHGWTVKKNEWMILMNTDLSKQFKKMILCCNTRGLVGLSMSKITVSSSFWRRPTWHDINLVVVGSQEWLMFQAHGDNSRPFVDLCWYILSTALHVYHPFTVVGCFLAVSALLSVDMLVFADKPQGLFTQPLNEL